MAKVDNPRFDPIGDVLCDDCPFDDEKDTGVNALCLTENCPTSSTYAAACELAEKEGHQ